MKCPFCDNEMHEGNITGDGRTKVRFEKDSEKLSLLDKVSGKGLIDVEYTLIPLAQFKIKAHYCSHCKKMIFDTNVSK